MTMQNVSELGEVMGFNRSPTGLSSSSCNINNNIHDTTLHPNEPSTSASIPFHPLPPSEIKQEPPDVSPSSIMDDFFSSELGW